MNNLKPIQKAIQSYVSFVAKSEETAMAKFFEIGGLLVTEFPETSARDIAEKLNCNGFGKSQVALCMKLSKDFHKAPKLAIREYRLLSGPLGKIDDPSKRLEVANGLHGKNNKEIAEVFKSFGVKYGKDKTSATTDETSSPDVAKVDRRRIEDFVKLCKRDNMLPVLLSVLAQSDSVEMQKAAKAAQDLVDAKKAAKLRKKAA